MEAEATEEGTKNWGRRTNREHKLELELRQEYKQREEGTKS